MPTTIRTVTYEQWLNMPMVENAIEEVMNGEIRITPPPKLKHTLIVERLAQLLRNQVSQADVLVLIPQFGFTMRRESLTSRVPDLAMFVKKNMVEQDGYVHPAPEFLVEVLSPANTRRRVADKIRDYEIIGAPEVWILSPEAQTAEVLLLENNKLVTNRILAQGHLSPRHFPLVAVDVSAIWPD
jgi:Uma2 family endonuclease